MPIKPLKIRQFHVHYYIKGKGKSIATDDVNYANKKAILNNGIIFEDIRCVGRKRLQRIYLKMKDKGTLPNEIDYPTLLK